MASQLNSYRNFIDITTKEGQALLSNAIDKYVSPLTGDDRITLSGTSFQKLKETLLRLASRFGYDYLIKVINTVRTVDPATGDVTYSVPINILERYSDDNVNLARKHASLTWGDRSFTVMATNTIGDFTVANGFLTAGGALTDDGKELVLERMHSKFLAHQLLELLTDSARQAIEQQSALYTWTSGRDEELDGLTILALVLARIRPNFKVDMFTEIAKVKKLSISQHDNDVQLYFDAITFLKLQIDQKDPTAYTEDAFIRDIFLQLKHESLPAEFRLEFARQETRWLMNKSVVTSQELMDDASAYFINLKNTGAWKMEISRNSQIIALTTQLTELKTEMSKLSASKGTPKLDDGKPAGGKGEKYVFELWRLEKVNNDAEHNMVERGGKTWWWCDKHRYNNKGVITHGMYVAHKPEGHDAWLEKRNKGRKVGTATSTGNEANTKLTTTPSVINDSSASKLSLSKSLQAALVTTAGISEDQFKKIWAEACNASGN